MNCPNDDDEAGKLALYFLAPEGKSRGLGMMRRVMQAMQDRVEVAERENERLSMELAELKQGKKARSA